MHRDITEGMMLDILPNPYRAPIGEAVCVKSIYECKLAVVYHHDAEKNYILDWKYLQPYTWDKRKPKPKKKLKAEVELEFV